MALVAADLVDGDTIVKLGLLLVGKVAEAVPLRRDLRVELPDVVVDDAGRLVDDLLVEELALEEACFFALGVEGPIQGDSFFGGGGGELSVHFFPFFSLFLLL